MDTHQNTGTTDILRHTLRVFMLCAAVMIPLRAQPLLAATAVIFSENFDGLTGAATSLEDLADADIVHTNVVIVDDDPVGGTSASGTQLISWQAHSAPNALLLRSGTEVDVYLVGARSGSKYQIDCWLYVAKGTGNRNFYVILRGEGADNNGSDYIAYRSDRAATGGILYYDGIAGAPAWVNTGASHIESTWQHHRLVVDTAAQKMDLYIDDMTTAVVTAVDLARCEVAVPTLLMIRHEGDSADDGYFIIDDISLTVENSVDLSTTFTDGFEKYAARTTPDDDADAQGPWITVETEGTDNNGGKPLAPWKVQVVDSTVVAAHSGTNCLKLEGGQRAGASIAWGVPPLSDVQVTWWARVPASVAGTTANYLRMSLYGAENGNTYGGDNALLGYGSRQAGLGDETSLTYYTTAWVDSGVDYTPDIWEEYRLITHTALGLYTILKNPSSPTPQVVVDRMPFIGTGIGTWAPVIIAAWSSSNGSGHPPVYIDDIEIKSLTSSVLPLGSYTVHLDSDRFTNLTTIVMTNMPVGSVAVDPRDKKTILFTTDLTGGSIYRAANVASGQWSVDSTPIVTGLDRPSGLAITADGTIWWTHDYNNDYTRGVVRLKEPWASSTPEVVISDFGPAGGSPIDDDAIDLTIAPATFNGTIGKPNMVVVADRGADGDALNAIYVIDPATTDLNQTGYINYLVNPGTELSAGNLNAITALPQSAEVVTLSQDGFIVAINADGTYRYIATTTLWVNPPAPAAAVIAADPVTGRLWVGDDTLDQLWSIAPDGATPDRQEVSFILEDPSRPDRQIDFHEPGMVFAPDGSFLVVTDGSTSNGGGRLHILHNDAPAPPSFSISGVTRTAQGVVLSWQAAGTARYQVQRSTNLANTVGFQDISGVLTGTEFTDTAPPEGAAFYRVMTVP